MIRRLLLAVAVLLTACRGNALPEQQANPAMWEVTGPHGEQGWLFGTIHALPEGVNWHRPAIDEAFAKADRLVVEVEDLDPAKIAPVFKALAHTDGLPPLSGRIPPKDHEKLDKALAEAKASDEQFRDVEDWAVAVMLSQAQNRANGLDSGNGVDVALIAAARQAGKPVIGLETVPGQLGLFDHLPPKAQRAMLVETVEDAGDSEKELRALQKAWMNGDEHALVRLGNEDLLGDPALRESLLVGRNRNWAQSIDTMLREGHRPFVAVGAAHLAGPDGVPAMLQAKGWTVRRVK